MCGNEPTTTGVCDCIPSMKKPKTSAFGCSLGTLPIPDIPPSVVGRTHCAQGKSCCGNKYVSGECNPCILIFTRPSKPKGGLASMTVAINQRTLSP